MEYRSHHDSAIKGIKHDGQSVEIIHLPLESPENCDKKYGKTSKSSGRNMYCNDKSALVSINHSQNNPGYDYKCQNVNLSDITKDETDYQYKGNTFSIDCGEGRALNSLETHQHPIISGQKKYAYQCGDIGKPECRKPMLPSSSGPIRIDILSTSRPVSITGPTALSQKDDQPLVLQKVAAERAEAAVQQQAVEQRLQRVLPKVAAERAEATVPQQAVEQRLQHIVVAPVTPVAPPPPLSPAEVKARQERQRQAIIDTRPTLPKVSAQKAEAVKAEAVKAEAVKAEEAVPTIFQPAEALLQLARSIIPGVAPEPTVPTIDPLTKASKNLGKKNSVKTDAITPGDAVKQWLDINHEHIVFIDRFPQNVYKIGFEIPQSTNNNKLSINTNVTRNDRKVASPIITIAESKDNGKYTYRAIQQHQGEREFSKVGVRMKDGYLEIYLDNQENYVTTERIPFFV